MVVTMQPAEKSKRHLFYSLGNLNHDKETGCIGHVRGDFGKGNEFWTTWWPHCEEYKTREFQSERDKLVNTLREKHGMLRNFALMKSHCSKHPEAKLSNSRGDTYGFEFVSDQYVYFLRLLPQKGNYNFYLYCYVREKVEKYFSTNDAAQQSTYPA